MNAKYLVKKCGQIFLLCDVRNYAVMKGDCREVLLLKVFLQALLLFNQQ